MRIYLNGKDATDGWRTQGANASPRLDTTAMLHIGARTVDSWDSRHASGAIDFVRIHDSALSGASIRSHYRELNPGAHDARCGRIPVIVSPEAGQWINGKSKLHVRIVPTPGCPDASFDSTWRPDDRVLVKIQRSFDDSVPFHGRMLRSITTFEEILSEGTNLDDGEVLISAALDSTGENDSSIDSSAPPAAGHALAGTAVTYGAARPILMGATTGVRRESTPHRPFLRRDAGAILVDGAARPVVLGLDGRASAWTAHRTESGWRLTPDRNESGVRIVRAGDRSSAIVLP